MAWLDRAASQRGFDKFPVEHVAPPANQPYAGGVLIR
jgi:hypothetical protein